MARYIDADALLSRLPDDLPYKASVKRVLIQAPEADVVEVVRCKDCEYWKDTSSDTVTEDHWGECRKPLGDYSYCETAEKDFCSYGERVGQPDEQ